jgi:Uma2 family endonuclease
MSIATKSVPKLTALPAELPPWRVHRFTVKQFQRMIESGVFGAEDRVELLEGWVINKVTQNPPHAVALELAQALLRALLPAGWHVREQKPITTPDSQPEPDLVVVQGLPRRYAKRHPTPRDVAVVVEVADETLLKDRTSKARLYARARLPVYWIINLVDAKVEVYTRPKRGKIPAYRERRDYGQDESVPFSVAGQELGLIAVRDLLP